MTANSPIDLRSDTVTLPTDAMREAIARAPVGDDQFGEDPTVNLLQERVAELLGKEAALFVPTGTMANQIALRIFTRPGDDVVVSRESHAVWHESGASGANASVQFTETGERGRITADEFRAACKPRDHIILPPTTLLEVENTHNRSGGVVVPQADVVQLCQAARALDVSTYLDGARLWNASVAQSRPPSVLAETFDLVSVALSKGLGAPAGSLLAGSQAIIQRAVRCRRMLGGAMRQTGILAAAGLYALDHHLERLREDHANARAFAEVLDRSPVFDIDLETVQTNIIVFSVAEGGPSAAQVVQAAGQRGVLLFAFGPRTLRAVTHLQVARDECERAARVLVEVASAA